jgi:hypothetical protein
MVQPVDEAPIQGSKTESLVDAYLVGQYSIAECNARFDAIRYWMDRIEKLNEKAPE